MVEQCVQCWNGVPEQLGSERLLAGCVALGFPERMKKGESNALTLFFLATASYANGSGGRELALSGRMTDIRTTGDRDSFTRRSVESLRDALSKVPPVTIAFWIVKIFATTVGETGGDALSMTLNLGYAVSTMIFLAFFCVMLIAQVATKPVSYTHLTLPTKRIV